MKYLFILFISLVFVKALFAQSLVFGVVPQQSPFKLIKVWQPVVDYLQKATGEKIVLKTERSIVEFKRVLYKGTYDIAYISPLQYVILHKKHGYISKIRDKKSIVGLLVANKNSAITDISDAVDKEFLFPAPNAFASMLITKYELLKQFNIHVDKVRYVNSHDSVYKGIARGIGDIGGGIERTFNNLSDKKTKDSLVILHRTKAYPSHPIVFKPSLSKAREDKLIQAFLNMPEKLLNALSMKKLIEIDDSEYDAVRDIANELSIIK